MNRKKLVQRKVLDKREYVMKPRTGKRPLKRVEKSFVSPSTGKTYKKHVWVVASPKESVIKPKSREDITKPTAPPSKEEIKSRTERGSGGDGGRTLIHGGDIRYRILTDKNYAVEQSLFLYEFQTDHEKKIKATKFKNMVGFNKPDAKFFSRMMEEIFNAGGFKKMIDKMGQAKQNEMSKEIQRRMHKYSNQLADIYNDNNMYRNFKTLADSFKHAKKISEKMLKGVGSEAQGGESLASREKAFELSYTSKPKSERKKTVTPEDLKRRAGEKLRGPKQKTESLSKRFNNSKYAAETWYMMHEMSTHSLSTIVDKFRAFKDHNPEGYERISSLMNDIGFEKMSLKQKTELKNYMKGASPFIVDAFNAFKDMGLDLPSTRGFRGKYKTVVGEPTLGDISGSPEKTAPISTEKKSDIKNKIFDIGEFTVDYGSRRGSNPGGIATHKETGDKYYYKEQKSEQHAKNEVLANNLYELFGYNVPKVSLVDAGDGKFGTVSKQTDGLIDFNHREASMVGEARKGYVTDAFLANQDVFGGAWDNLKIGKDGKAVRIDPGGSLLFRARGEAKGEKFGNEVRELDTFLTTGNASRVFGAESILGEMTPNEMIDSFKQFSKVNIDDIKKVVNDVGFDEKTSKELNNTLEARYNDVVRKMGGLKESKPTTSTKTKSSTPTSSLDKKAIRSERLSSERQHKTLEYAEKFGTITPEAVAELNRSYGTKYTVSEMEEFSKFILDNMELRINFPFTEGGTNNRAYKSILKDGIVKNQFTLEAESPGSAESKGSLSPHKGGCRDSWERNLSNGILHTAPGYGAIREGSPLTVELARERPIYGYIQDGKDPHSASQYGDVAVTLNNEAKLRATSTMSNSSWFGSKEDNYGTSDKNLHLIKSALKTTGGNIETFKRQMLTGKHSWGSMGYVEAQIYGGVDFSKDVSFMTIQDDGYSTHDHVLNIAEKYNIPYEVKKKPARSQ